MHASERLKPVLIEELGPVGVCGRRLLYSSMSGARDVTVVTTQKFSVITPRMAPRKDDPYDCINMQQQPATDKGLVNAEMLAALPHKIQADPPQDTSAIYTFLGLATIPRLGKANPRLITNNGAAASRSWSETSPTGRGCGRRRMFAFRGALSRAGPRTTRTYRPPRFSRRRRTR